MLVSSRLLLMAPWQVFVAWSQTTILRDEDRALKRLINTRCLYRRRITWLTLLYRFKTQMQHVQNSEERLENKRKHCTICQLYLKRSIGALT